MSKSLFIAEKPSVAKEFAKSLKLGQTKNFEGYIESETAVVTWCVGHLVTMSYPEAYDEKYKKWRLDTLPFLPEVFRYEVIPSVSKQFKIVANLLNRPDVDTIYVCTDSGREGEYIYRLVEQMAFGNGKKVSENQVGESVTISGKTRKRVWIDSQTEDEILRGIREAKDLSEYDALSESAYLRAKEDYLMGINFSRLLTLKYGQSISSFLNTRYTVISVGRVMTCVLGMVVRREREIRDFVKTPFYRVLSNFSIPGSESEDQEAEGEWKAVEGSKYFQSPKLYKENGFRKKEDAQALISELSEPSPILATVVSKETKKENKNPPLLYNLAELQNDCSKMFKISPDETLKVAQELYEKKLLTYPRTDARVLSTAVAKEISKNIKGLANLPQVAEFAQEILNSGKHQGIAKTRYVNDKQITDHYAIIPTGQGLGALRGLSSTASAIYETVVRRFLSIFYPAAVYQKISLVTQIKEESFFSSYKRLVDPGYLKVLQDSSWQKQDFSPEFLEALSHLKKGSKVNVSKLLIKEGETSPPKRYTSGSLILAMENAGQLIEDEELRAQIKGSGIGTSATRAEILKKLIHNKYLSLNKKTQLVTPDLLGELIFDVVDASIRSLLNPDLTASWEKGLTYVAEQSISSGEYMEKLDKFVRSRTEGVLGLYNQSDLMGRFRYISNYYPKPKDMPTRK